MKIKSAPRMPLVAMLVCINIVAADTITTDTHKTQGWKVASSLPETAGPPVDPSFPGFAFEVSSFYNYAIDADGKPNEFSQNLINEVLQRTGGTPILRVGGTSGDHGTFVDTRLRNNPVNLPATQHRPAFTRPFLEVGDAYFKAFESFPNARFILMVPLQARNATNSIAWAKAALARIKNLDALEIGNEPDFYSWFSIAAYTHAFNSMREKLQDAIPSLRKRAVFQAIDKAWGHPRHELSVAAVHDALNKTGAIKQYAYHYYQSGGRWSDAVLENSIANHSRTVEGMASLQPNIAFLQRSGHAEQVPFLIDELGAHMHPGEGHNNLATALWAVDYQLHCMAIGVARVNWQQIVAPGFNQWEPVQSKWGPPMVRANFYSQPFVADFIGNQTSPRVNEVPMSGHTLAAYTAWENEKLMRIAIVNLEIWGGDAKYPSTRFEISGLAPDVASATIRCLSAPEGSLANDTLTYGGLQWTYQSRGKAVVRKQESETIAVKQRTLTLSVDAGSAVLIILNSASEGGYTAQPSSKSSTTTRGYTPQTSRKISATKEVGPTIRTRTLKVVHTATVQAPRV